MATSCFTNAVASPAEHGIILEEARCSRVVFPSRREQDSFPFQACDAVQHVCWNWIEFRGHEKYLRQLKWHRSYVV